MGTSKHPAVPYNSIRGTNNDTYFIAMIPLNLDVAKPPVVNLHGTSAHRGRDEIIEPVLNKPSSPFAIERWAYRALLATGRAIFFPWLGNNVGTEGPGVPDLGGTGYLSVTNIRDYALDVGINADKVDVWGTSGGATTALNWAWRNPELLNRMLIQSPGLYMDHIFDCDAISEAAGLGKLSEMMMSVHGGTDKASWYPLSEAYDPNRNRNLIAPIADRVTVFSAMDDPLVPWSNIEDIDADVGFREVISSNLPGLPGGEHWVPAMYPGWSDLTPLRAFTEHAEL